MFFFLLVLMITPLSEETPVVGGYAGEGMDGWMGGWME